MFILRNASQILRYCGFLCAHATNAQVDFGIRVLLTCILTEKTYTTKVVILHLNANIFSEFSNLKIKYDLPIAFAS